MSLRNLAAAIARSCAALVAAAILFCSNPSIARAEDWPRLPNGDVVITVKGVRLALPSADNESTRKYIYFNDDKFQTMPFDRANLQWVIENRDEARAKFDAAKNVMLTLSSGYPGSELFVGKFDKSLFRTFKAEVWIYGERTCKRWDNTTIPSIRQQIESGELRPSENGWAMKVIGRSPRDEYYVYASNQTFLEAIVCDFSETCRAGHCLNDNVGASIQFYRPIIPEREWLQLDERARDLLRSVFIDVKF